MLPSVSSVDDYKPGMKFQCLWALHGGGNDDLEWQNNTNLMRHAEENCFAVVMPSARDGMYSNTAYGHKYWTLISEELPSLVRAYFPLSRKRENTFITGISMGGHGAMKFAINHPEMFSTCILLSGASSGFDEMLRLQATKDKTVPPDMDNIYGDFSDRRYSGDDVWYIGEKNVECSRELPKFYLAYGEKDPGKDRYASARDYLIRTGYDLTWETLQGYGHEYDFWDIYINKMIKEWLPLKKAPLYSE